MPVAFGHWISALGDLSNDGLKAAHDLLCRLFRDSTKDVEHAVGTFKSDHVPPPWGHTQDVFDASVSLPSAFVDGLHVLRQHLKWARRCLLPKRYVAWHQEVLSEMGLHLCRRVVNQETRAHGTAPYVAALLNRMCQSLLSLYGETTGEEGLLARDSDSSRRSGPQPLPLPLPLPHGLCCVQDVGNVLALPRRKAADLCKVLVNLIDSVSSQHQTALQLSWNAFRKAVECEGASSDSSLAQIYGSLEELRMAWLSPHQVVDVLQIRLGHD
jgi:hypothetical protein